MKTAPAYVSQALKRLDPLLGIRWSREKRRFLVERKVRHWWALTPPVYWEKDGYGKEVQVKMPEYSDRAVCWKNKTIPILYIRNPDSRLIHYLRVQDAQRFRMEREAVKSLTAHEQKEEAKVQQKAKSDLEDVSGEAYDDMMWKSGLRMAV